MGALLTTLGFEWNPPTYVPGAKTDTIKMEETVSDERLVVEIMSFATKNTYRVPIYRCDFYKGLDPRVPVSENTHSISEDIMFRMNIDHPLVYVLVTEYGQQPVHITEDYYGELAVYRGADVEDGITYLISLCSAAGYEIQPDPVETTSEDKAE